jgi:hypothetical protein
LKSKNYRKSSVYSLTRGEAHTHAHVQQQQEQTNKQNEDETRRTEIKTAAYHGSITEDARTITITGADRKVEVMITLEIYEKRR